MSRSVSRAARAILLAGATASIALLPGGPAAAGTPSTPITFETWVGSCPGGYAHGDTRVDVTIRSAAGDLIATDFTFSETGGFWQVCPEGQSVKTGQQLTASYVGGGNARTVTVPKVTVSIDRATNVSKGTAAPGSTVMLEQWNCVLLSCNIAKQVDVTVPASGTSKGRWSRSWSGPGIDGGDHLRAYRIFEGPAGTDRFFADAFAPFITVRATQPWNAQIFSAKTGDVAIETLDQSGKVRGTITHRFKKPALQTLPFLKNGQRVTPRAGDRIVSTTLAKDVSMTLPPLTVAVDAGLDTLTATCFANRPYLVTITPAASGTLEFTGTTNPTGAVAISTTIGNGDTAIVVCEDKHGDRLVLRGAAPAP